MARPTAAEALFGHLPHRSDDQAPEQAQPAPSLSAAMYPALAEKSENEWRERNRKTILPDIRGATERGR